MDSFGVLLGCFVVENDDDEERPIERNSTEFARRFSEPPTMTFDEDGIPSMNPTARGHFLPPYGSQTSTARRVSNGPRLVWLGGQESKCAIRVEAAKPLIGVVDIPEGAIGSPPGTTAVFVDPGTHVGIRRRNLGDLTVAPSHDRDSTAFFWA